MINRFAGTCFRCGQKVFAGCGEAIQPTAPMISTWRKEGFRPGYPRVEWLVQHAECSRKFDGTLVHHRYHPEQTQPERKEP